MSNHNDDPTGPRSDSDPGRDQNQTHDDRERPGIDDTHWEGTSEERERARARHRAERARHRRRSRERRGQRKGRVLHTRISEQLSDDIRRLAEDLRVPTSNLVRNVLEEVFEVVESVSDDVGDLFEDVLEEANAARERIRRRSERSTRRAHHRHGSRHRDSWADVAEAEISRDEAIEREVPPASEAARPAFPDVIGWQPLVMNQPQECADCGERIPRGTRAFVGVKESGISRTTLCRTCIQER